jgi:hypothetical protein
MIRYQKAIEVLQQQLRRNWIHYSNFVLVGKFSKQAIGRGPKVDNPRARLETSDFSSLLLP